MTRSLAGNFLRKRMRLALRLASVALLAVLVHGCGWKVLLECAVELACWCCCQG